MKKIALSIAALALTFGAFAAAAPTASAHYAPGYHYHPYPYYPVYPVARAVTRVHRAAHQYCYYYGCW